MDIWAGRRIMVTGGAGVIGRPLVEMLAGGGAEVWVGDRQACPSDWLRRQWPGQGIWYWRGDLNTLTEEDVAEFNPEVVFHLAATFERSAESPVFWQRNYEDNLQLSHHLLSLMKGRRNLSQIVFASSYLVYDPRLYMGSAYGEPARLAEESALRPRNLCGATKLLHEAELRFVADCTPGLTVVSARIFRVYGRGSQDVISRWVRCAIAGEPCDMYGTDAMFDYVFADDVAEGLVRLAQAEMATGPVNLATGRARPVSDAIAILREHFPDLATRKIDAPERDLEASEGDVSWLKNLTGWTPGCSLEEGIGMVIAYEREHQPPRHVHLM